MGASVRPAAAAAAVEPASDFASRTHAEPASRDVAACEAKVNEIATATEVHIASTDGSAGAPGKDIAISVSVHMPSGGGDGAVHGSTDAAVQVLTHPSAAADGALIAVHVHAQDSVSVHSAPPANEVRLAREDSRAHVHADTPDSELSKLADVSDARERAHEGAAAQRAADAHSHLQAALLLATRAVEDARSREATLTNELEALKAQLTLAGSELSSSRAECERASAAAAVLREDVERLEGEAAAARQEYDSLKTEREQELVELQKLRQAAFAAGKSTGSNAGFWNQDDFRNEFKAFTTSRLANLLEGPDEWGLLCAVAESEGSARPVNVRVWLCVSSLLLCCKRRADEQLERRRTDTLRALVLSSLDASVDTTPDHLMAQIRASTAFDVCVRAANELMFTHEWGLKRGVEEVVKRWQSIVSAKLWCTGKPWTQFCSNAKLQAALRQVASSALRLFAWSEIANAHLRVRIAAWQRKLVDDATKLTLWDEDVSARLTPGGCVAAFGLRLDSRTPLPSGAASPAHAHTDTGSATSSTHASPSLDESVWGSGPWPSEDGGKDRLDAGVKAPVTRVTHEEREDPTMDDLLEIDTHAAV